MRHKIEFVLSVLAILVFVLAGCKNDVIDAGSSVLESEDSVVVRADTFRLTSSLVRGGAVTATPDSFMLGELDSKYGHLHADLLTQLACPVGFVYPESAVLDSVCIFLYYRYAQGDENAPLLINAYAMDRGTFVYNEPLRSDAPIEDYCSLEDSTRMLEHPAIITAKRYTDSTYYASQYIPTITLKLNDTWAKKLFAADDFSSQDAFNKLFKGLYLTTEFGGSTLLSVLDVNVGIYYHFTYERAGVETVKEQDMKGLYANREVRQLNRYVWQESDLEALEQNTDTNFIISPAHIYTQVSFPMAAMKEAITRSLGTRRPYVNRARLTLPVLNKYSGSASQRTRDDWAQPSEVMLLVRKGDLEKLFNDEIVLSDSIAMYAVLKSVTDTFDITTYSYEFDLSTLLTAQLREDRYGTLDMWLVPITVGSTTTTTTATAASASVEIEYNQSLTATEIYSAQHPLNNLELEVVYSGF
ncbi:MAG: DUF4270 family protein [Paludibacteraceae bacterium]|nr:DUF4270 family protein [Paludibacteraceae bacterium]